MNPIELFSWLRVRMPGVIPSLVPYDQRRAWQRRSGGSVRQARGAANRDAFCKIHPTPSFCAWICSTSRWSRRDPPPRRRTMLSQAHSESTGTRAPLSASMRSARWSASSRVTLIPRGGRSCSWIWAPSIGKTGHFLQRALETWQSAWDESKGLTDRNGYGHWRRGQGLPFAIRSVPRAERGDSKPLLVEVKARPVRGAAAQWVTMSMRGLSDMIHRPEKIFRCGPLALVADSRAEFARQSPSLQCPRGGSIDPQRLIADGRAEDVGRRGNELPE